MSDSVQDSTRYVVKDRHPGSVLPGTRDELKRDVFLEAGADVRGSVFGRNVQIEGAPVRVRDSVFSSGSISIEDDPERTSNGSVDFCGVVNAQHSVLFSEGCRHRARFFGDVFSDRVRIENALIRGNLFARNAILRNTVVLGGVFCSGELTVEDSALATFRAKQVTLAGEVLLFEPFALAEKPFEVKTPVKVLTFSSLHRLTKHGDGLDFVVFLDGDDVVQVTETVDGEERDLYLLSLGSRLLDIEGAKESIRDNQRTLESLALGAHLLPSSKLEFESTELRKVEDALHALLASPPKEEKMPRVAFADLEAREESPHLRGKESA